MKAKFLLTYRFLFGKQQMARLLPLCLFFAALYPCGASAQQPDESTVLRGMTVTASRVPLDETTSAKKVTVVTREEIEAAAVHTINDLLEYVSEADVRQRGEFGVQTDISIDGGSFDQIMILLNGINISSPQTGHLSGDFPVALSDIERIEVLSGPAARVLGSAAFMGAVNIITRVSETRGLTVGASGGSYGYANGNAMLSLPGKTIDNQISGGYSRSDGASHNSDFRVARAFYQGACRTPDADIFWQFGFSDRAFGANTFYSAAYPNQYEETRRYMAAVRAETKGWLTLTPAIYWNRLHDHFQLIRGTNTGENFHMTDTYGAMLNGYFKTILGKTALGAEIRNEGVLSTNLGRPLESEQYVRVPGQTDVWFDKRDNRTNVSYYLEHNVLLNKVTVSLGVLGNMNTSLDHKFRFYPGVDVSYRPSASWKLFASYGESLRMPTFTDLYYQSPTIQGNIGLKPEELKSVSVGARYRTPVLELFARGFYYKGTNMIDWVKYSEDDKFHSANFKLDNMGFQTTAAINFGQLFDGDFAPKRLLLGYTYIHQRRHDDTEIFKSNYALEYLRHKFVARLEQKLSSRLSANFAFRWQQRMGGYQRYDADHRPTGEMVNYPSYCIVDVKIIWRERNYEIFAEASNLLDRTYRDFGNIPQPGIWIRVGASYRFGF